MSFFVSGKKLFTFLKVKLFVNWYSFKKYFYTNYICVGFLKQISRNVSSVSYTNFDETFTIVFPKKRGRNPVKKVMCDGEDKTRDIFSKMGPYYNFHGIPTTPNMLGYTNMIFTKIRPVGTGGNEKKFSEDETIVF